MKTMRTMMRILAPLALALGGVASSQDDPLAAPALARFLADGEGELHPDAPEQTMQFGQLVGLWEGQQEMRGRDGEWSQVATGLWAWKYALGGFAVQDLWYQGVDDLPPYLAGLGRDYLLSATRLFEARTGRWKIAWMSNGAGQTPGNDFGTFEATWVDDRIVMSSPPDPRYGAQRVVFADITEDSFLWLSEFSQDGGKSWTTTMRMKLRRLR